MEFQEIQDKLNALLTGDKRKVVFWYDDDAAYAEEVDNLQLGENCKLWKLTKGNHFATKLQIEEREPDVNFIVYATFARPEDKGNHLADIFLVKFKDSGGGIKLKEHRLFASKEEAEASITKSTKKTAYRSPYDYI